MATAILNRRRCSRLGAHKWRRSGFPSGNWRAQVRRAGQRPIAKTFEKRAEALVWARVMEGDRDAIAAFPDAEARGAPWGRPSRLSCSDTPAATVVVRRLAWWKEPIRHDAARRFQTRRGQGRTPGARPRARVTVAGKRGASRSIARKALGRSTAILQAVCGVLSWASTRTGSTEQGAGRKRRPEPAGACVI